MNHLSFARRHRDGVLKHFYLLHILKDQVELPPPAEGLLQLHDVLLLERAKHLELPQRRFFDLFIFCVEGRKQRRGGKQKGGHRGWKLNQDRR